MIAPTALLSAKHAAASLAVAVAMASVLHPATAMSTAAPPPTGHRIVVAPAIELAASVTTDGSSQQVGVADAYLYTLDQTQLVSQLNEIRSLGVTDLRIVVPWIYIQPTSSTYNWSQMDNVINTAHSMGFSLTASITGNPTWDGTPLIGAPNPANYATFAAAVAQRYTGQISAYEILNEPNAVTFMAPADPAVYTAILKAAYTAIKAVQPSATVIAGVLGAVTTVPGISLSPEQFLAGMYAAGAKNSFNEVSFHPYNYTLPFSAGAGVANSPLEQALAMYALMVANGDGAKQIWATEYGNPSQPGGITQTQQAQMLQDFVTAWSKLSFAGPAFVYTAADLNTGFLLDENNMGLFTSDGTPKLAAQTLATLISQLAAGTLPNYTAPVMPVAQTVWIQVVSLVISVTNEVLLLPNMATQAIYNTLPAPLQQAFSTVANAVSMAAGMALTAVTPLAERAIDTIVTAGPNIQNAAAAINSAIQNAALAVGTAAHNTELTVAGAVQALAAVPSPAAATLPAAAMTPARATASAPSSTVGATLPEQYSMLATATPTTGAIAGSSTATATATVNSTTTVSTPAGTAAASSPAPAPSALPVSSPASSVQNPVSAATNVKPSVQTPTSATTAAQPTITTASTGTAERAAASDAVSSAPPAKNSNASTGPKTGAVDRGHSPSAAETTRTASDKPSARSSSTGTSERTSTSASGTGALSKTATTETGRHGGTDQTSHSKEAAR
ncbi:cellulase family glycosylhydrolase [Mycolicibacterium aubagnense]|nr:cellulase family glycosylhydrolase [Mycolicibacterium aubagnense]TLH64452.1 hypothetical protein C1S80_12265 [Mycolicibacterium aubagnense]